MRDPVLAADGVSYERSEIISWMKSGNTTSPVTGREIKTKLLFTNVHLRSMILEWERMNTGMAEYDAPVDESSPRRDSKLVSKGADEVEGGADEGGVDEQAAK